MRSIVEWLLGLRDIRLSPGAPVSLEWHSPWPAWVVAMVVAIGVVVIVLLYRRQPARGAKRLALVGLRAAALVLVIATLCQPRLLLEQTIREQSRTAIVLDGSASMTRRDLYADPRERQAAESVVSADRVADATRIALARAALLEANGGVVSALLNTQIVDAYRADADASLLASAGARADASQLAEPLTRFEPTGDRTDLARAVETVLSDQQGKPLSAVVLVSDGRSTVPADFRRVVDLANRRGIRIHTVALGSTTPLKDVAVAPIDVDERVFVKDLVAFKTRIEASGFDTPTPVTVQLFEEGRDAPLAEETVLVGGQTGVVPIELRMRPRRAGRRQYRVAVPALPSEMETHNNTESAFVEAVEDRLRVLFVDGYPRFEYRYFKNTLVREPTLVSSCLLLSADAQFVQEGDEPIRRFPETPEELFRYDAIIFGDVDPHGPWLGDAAAKMLLDFVGHRGGGIGFVAGQAWNPQRFAGTPLEPLIPVVIESSGGTRADEDSVNGFRPQLTPAGALHPIFRLEADAERNAETIDRLPPVYWSAVSLGPKPGAEVLLTHPTRTTEQGPMPLVVVGRYGAGRTFFQATDDTWRWRRYTGEGFYDTYWLHVVRFLAQSKLAGTNRRFRLDTDRAVYAFGQPVRVTMSVLDAADAAAMPSRMDAVISDIAGVPRERVTLLRDEGAADAPRFTGYVTPAIEGQLIVTAAPPGIGPGERPPTHTFRVVQKSLESREPEPDHDVLLQLATQTGGRRFFIDEIGELPSMIEDRSVEIPHDRFESIWDSKLAAGLFVLIIGVEWLVRKLTGLV